MADVTLRRDDYEDGALPQVCIVSGDRAEILVDHRSRAGAPGWLALLILLGPAGIIGLLIIDQLMKVEATGLVPMSRAVHAGRRAERRRWDSVALGCGAAVLLGVAGLFAAPDVAGLWLLVVLVAVVVGVAAWYAPSVRLVQGRPDRAGRSVALRNVHPAFAAAYRAQDDRRAEERRRALGTATDPAWSDRSSF